MGMSAEAYKRQLLQLLPRGSAWEVQPGSNFDRLLSGLSVELARIDARAQDLLNEIDPRTTYELLEDWERVLGLPDDCTGEAATIEERRQQIVAKLIMLGGQSIQFFKDLAASLGYTIEIEEYEPFRAEDRAEERCYGMAWLHAFSVISSAGSVRDFRADQSYAEERLIEFGNTVLECIINKAKPAHTIAIFEYQ